MYFTLSYTIGPSDDKESDLVHRTASFSLLLPGNILYLTPLNNARRFRGRGNKSGAITSWEHLVESELGTLQKTRAKRGTDLVCLMNVV